MASVLLAGAAYAEEPASPPASKRLLGIDGLEGVAFRPQVAVGWSYAADNGFRNALSTLAGARLLLSPGGSTWIGGELSWLGHDNHMGGSIPRNALVGGLVVEQVVARQFLVALGSLGMVGLDRHSQNAPDLMLELGWAPPGLLGRTIPLISYRSDFILTQPVVSTRTLAVGLGWRW
ncbi:MAG: hypothetical protein L6R48_22770 [Planctomycetes bacterium]|nr:hypothetical protein [Planctomycetota bacterium]